MHILYWGLGVHTVLGCTFVGYSAYVGGTARYALKEWRSALDVLLGLTCWELLLGGKVVEAWWYQRAERKAGRAPYHYKARV